MTAGERLMKLRLRENIPRAIIAEWLHRSPTTLRKIELGQRDMYPAEIEAAAKIFRITPEELCDGMGKTMASGDRLRVLRKRAGLTLRELGALAGVHEETLGRWERGDQPPSEIGLRRVAEALEVPPETLCGGKKWRMV